MTESVSVQGRKGSSCPPHLDGVDIELLSPCQGSPESELVGVGEQFVALRMQAQDRQLSFS